MSQRMTAATSILTSTVTAVEIFMAKTPGRGATTPKSRATSLCNLFGAVAGNLLAFSCLEWIRRTRLAPVLSGSFRMAGHYGPGVRSVEVSLP